MESVDSPVQHIDNSPPPAPPATPPTPTQNLSPLPPIQVSLPSSSGLNRLLSTTPADTLHSQTYWHVYVLVYEVTASLYCIVDCIHYQV